MTEGTASRDTVAQADVDRFLLRVIHDLRAPLRQAFHRAQLLERAAGTPTAESGAHLKSLLEAHSQVDKFLTRLAEFSQAGSRVDQIPPVHAEVLLGNAIQQCGASPDGVVIVGAAPQCLLPTPVQKVLFELIDNARKFHREPAAVQVRSTVTSECTFEITDQGIGFESRYGEVIWEPLQMLHGVGEYPGFGLGLAICRRIVTRLNGRIWATSQPGVGSTFSFAVPLP